jgi:membrane-bound metal-dependent hydrolase YbcI (DUF457 family)
MPVIGHALVGIVVAQHVGANTPRGRAASTAARAMWVPAIVSLSYLPDVLTQCGVWLGFAWAQAAGHSVAAALVIGVSIGLCCNRATGAPFLRMAAVTTGVLLLHDGLDLLQDAGRMPLWPFSTMEIGRDWLRFDHRVIGELLTFGVPFVAWLVWRKVTGRSTLGMQEEPAGARWAIAAYVGAVLFATLGVVHLREERETQMDRAKQLLRAGRFTEALSALDAAEEWPSSPGQGDLLRGRVFATMGDETRAEHTFLRAYRNDPHAFWTNAVLAEFYASRGPADARRTRSAPYVERLRREFARNDAFPRVIERIDRELTSGGE